MGNMSLTREHLRILREATYDNPLTLSAPTPNTLKALKDLFAAGYLERNPSTATDVYVVRRTSLGADLFQTEDKLRTALRNLVAALPRVRFAASPYRLKEVRAAEKLLRELGDA